MNRRLLTAIVAMLMMLLPISLFSQGTAYVSTYAELSAAIANASVNNIVVTANIDVPCGTSGNAGQNSTDPSGTSTAQLIINRSLTLQSQAGNKYMLKRVPASGANSSYLKSMIAIRGNGHENNGTDNNTENTIEVSFTNIIIDGGANWGSSSVCQRRNGSADAYGNAGRSIIDVYLGGILNLEDGVEIRNGFTTKSDNSLLNDASTSQCFGGAVRVDYHNKTGGGTVNIKAGAIIHDCTTLGDNTGYGGALGAYNYARLNLYGGTISNCTSAHGGAIACTYRGATGYGDTTAGTIRMYGGTISNCCAKYGGAISMDGSVTNYLLGGTIENCSASSKGSAICIPEANTTVNMVAYTSHLLTITNCTGGNNTSTENTGGYAGVYKNESATIAETPVYHVTFQNNNTTFAVLSVAQGTSLGEAFPAAPVNANFRFVGWYNGNTQVTSTTTITGNITVTAKWDFLGSGTSAEPYLIPSTEVWNFLADQVAAGNTYSGKYFRQTADIGTAEEPVTQMVGIYSSTESENRTFRGTYDGLGHTLTFSYGAAEAYGNKDHVAPFRNVCGENEQTPARIQNLHVTGHIYTLTKYAAGIIAQTGGSVNMENCRSSMVIHSSVGGDGSHGGLVGGITSTLSITGCVFDGKLLYTGTTATNSCGGFVGWNGGSLSITNSLYAPATIDTQHGENEVNASYSATFSRNGATFTNCYYTCALGTAQGERAYSVTGGTGVTVAAAGTPTASYDVSELDFYGTNGFALNGKLYGGNGDALSLNLSGAEHYAATTGTLSGSANPYTLTMAAANSEIVLPVASVTTSSNVTSYHATLVSALSAWEANSTLTLLADVTTSSTIVVSNTCTLDLKGHGIKMTGTGPVIAINVGGNLTLNDSDPTTEHHFDVNVNNVATLNEASGSLTIYGGYITGGSNNYGGAIDVANSGVNDQNGPSLTMNAGTLIGNSGGNGGVGGVCVSRDTKDYFNTFTMNGGAICYNDQIGVGVYPQGTFHMNGGVVHHNNGIGVKMWHSKLLTLNNAVITDNNGWGIEVDTRRAAIQVQGRTIISGNTPCDIYFYRASPGSIALSIVEALHSEARIGINNHTNTPDPFTSGLNGRGNASNFFSNDANYIVGLYPSGEAYLHVPYTVTYNGNGNDGGTVPTDNATYAGGVAVTIPSTVPTKTDYTFTGWLNSVDNHTYAAGENFTITANTTLTAQWTINEYRIDSIRTNWTVEFGGTSHSVIAYSANDTMGYVMIPVNSEFVIIPSDGQKPLVSKLELIDKTVPTGALSGKFTVSATKQVYFSQGNLQYTKSTSTWSFMEHQYSTVETLNQDVGTNYSSQNVVSLFGYATSGYNHGSICYQPYSTANTEENYYPYGSSDYSVNLYSSTGKADWGYNAISNGGNTENSGWRTLTNDEWVYLFNASGGGSGRSDLYRFAGGTIHGVLGLIIFPDGFDPTATGVSITGANTTEGLDFTVYSDADWDKMEAAGCVFLPAAGYRFPTSVNKVGEQGQYWSSTRDNTSTVRCLSFSAPYNDPEFNMSVPGMVGVGGFTRYRFGSSVRLVRDAN